jgi:hypothetical protein
MTMAALLWPEGMVEPVPVEDDLCSRLGYVEDVGGYAARFYVVADQTIVENGMRICAVKRKIVLPYEAILPGIEMAGRFYAVQTAHRIGNVVKLFAPR